MNQIDSQKFPGQLQERVRRLVLQTELNLTHVKLQGIWLNPFPLCTASLPLSTPEPQRLLKAGQACDQVESNVEPGTGT